MALTTNQQQFESAPHAGSTQDDVVNIDSGTIAKVYLRAIHSEVNRVLSLMDRESFSPTLGCMDRTFWAWKFTDFPGARFQEGLCVLSFLSSQPFEGSQFHQNGRLLEWISAGVDYWTRVQYRGGAFDEAYPLERSLAATAFTLFYLSEAWSFLDGQLPEPTADRFKRAVEGAGGWLVNNDETHGFLSNHLAAAAAALLHAYRITGQARFEERSRYFVDKILSHQSSEGWYDEYGGADPGYQTHGSFYLARYQQLSGDERLLESLRASLDFLAHFVHPDGSLGGEYASRNTQTYYPAAFEMMSSQSGVAHWIAANMLSSVQSLHAAGLGTVDAYNYFPLLNNYVFAYQACLSVEHRNSDPTGPSDAAGLVHFPKAGLAKVRTTDLDVYVGLNKGGVVKAFDRETKQLICNDCGYLGRLKNGKIASSQGEDAGRKIDVSEDEIVVEGQFFESKKLVQRPLLFLTFRIFSLTLGRFPRVSYWLKKLLVKVLIYRKKPLDLNFKRRIKFDENGFTVEDNLRGSEGNRIERLCWVDVFTTIHMGSSKYFIPNELNLHEQPGRVDIDVNKLRHGVTVERRISAPPSPPLPHGLAANDPPNRERFAGKPMGERDGARGSS